MPNIARSDVGDLVTAAEAATILGVTPEHVSRLARDGHLPEAIKGRGLRGPRWFTRADVEALKAARHTGAA